MGAGGFTRTLRVAEQQVTLYSAAITAAETGLTTSPLTVPGLSALTILATFTYGSGGTSAKYYVQTSLDKGTSWIDIASFAFTTSSATKVSAVFGAVALTAATTPSDGSLTDNTILNGLLGDRLRLKRTTTGTYAGTTVAINVVMRG